MFISGYKISMTIRNRQWHGCLLLCSPALHCKPWLLCLTHNTIAHDCQITLQRSAFCRHDRPLLCPTYRVEMFRVYTRAERTVSECILRAFRAFFNCTVRIRKGAYRTGFSIAAPSSIISFHWDTVIFFLYMCRYACGMKGYNVIERL